jgi:gluconate 2-dehydrogenase gamma chain
MEEQKYRTPGHSRRSVLVGGFSGLSSIWLTTHLPGILSAKRHADAIAALGRPGTLEFFSAKQAVEVESVAAQVIPTDDTPGAREAGTVYFIDRILNTFEREKQGMYTQGLTDLRAKTRDLFPSVDKFSELKSDQQIQVLSTIEKTAFFAQIRLHTIVGFFANPEYSGNQNKIGWNLIGFEDKFDWRPPFGYYDRDENNRS